MKFQAATETLYYRENPYRDHLRDRTVTHSRVTARCGQPSPSSRPERLAHAHRHVASPGPVVAQIGHAQVGIARPQPVEQEVLSHAKLESLRDIESPSPRVLDANRIRRPGIE